MFDKGDNPSPTSTLRILCFRPLIITLPLPALLESFHLLTMSENFPRVVAMRRT